MSRLIYLIRWFNISLALILLSLACLLGLLDAVLPPPLGQNIEYSVEVVDATGVAKLRIYTTKAGYWRLPIKIAELDPQFVKLLLGYEDRRFYQHSGVDLLAMLRALGQAIFFGRFVSGASTITMQTARLLHPRPRNFKSKIIEIWRAFQMESRLSKTQILTLYLNLAPYGGNIQGIRAASIFYFGKEPSFLTLAEAALLIALPQAPESRRPDRAPKRHLQIVRDNVINRLVKNGLINPQYAAQALLAALPHKRRPTPRLAPHFTDRLHFLHPQRQSIHSTLDFALQRSLETLVSRHQLQQPKAITLAALVLENRTWNVRAYVGSGDYFNTTFPGQVDMVKALRSPGSALKPFVYGLAFDANIAHPETFIFDRPEVISGYAPGNFDKRYQGEIRIREALITSRNIPAVKVLDRLGTPTLLQNFTNADVKLHFPKQVLNPGLPIVLGGVGISLEELVRLYASLATQGKISNNINMISELTATQSRKIATTQLLSAASTWYLTDILSGSPSPQGFTIQKKGIAFKTGTSYGYRDAWAIGYNSSHTVGVWLGRPDNGYTANLSGLQAAAPILLEIFAHLPNTGLVPLLSNPPPEVLQVKNINLPISLRHFDVQQQFPLLTQLRSPKLRIIYPPPGAVVELADETSAYLSLELTGGAAPFHLLVNGIPLIKQQLHNSFSWKSNITGDIELTVLDAKGHSDRVQVRVQRLANSSTSQ